MLWTLQKLIVCEVSAAAVVFFKNGLKVSLNSGVECSYTPREKIFKSSMPPSGQTAWPHAFQDKKGLGCLIKRSSKPQKWRKILPLSKDLPFLTVSLLLHPDMHVWFEARWWQRTGPLWLESTSALSTILFLGTRSADRTAGRISL